MGGSISLPEPLALELQVLCCASLDGTASQEEIARLDELVCKDAAARRYVARLLQTSNHLRLWAASQTKTIAGLPVDVQPTRAPILGFLGNMGFAGGAFTPTFWTLSAIVSGLTFTLMVAIFFASWVGHPRIAGQNAVPGINPGLVNTGPEVEQHLAAGRQPAEGSSRPASVPDASKPNSSGRGSATVARLVGVVDCRWSGMQSDPAQGDALPPGMTFKLEHGLAEIVFVHGARVIVEGPTALELLSENSANLFSGKMTATAPGSAAGFVVRTPSSQITTMGAEFGVSVESGGQSDMQVFHGKLRVDGVAAIVRQAAQRTEAAPNSVPSESEKIFMQLRSRDPAFPRLQVAPQFLASEESAHIEAPDKSSRPPLFVRQASAPTYFVRSMAILPRRAAISNASFEEPRLQPEEMWRDGMPGWVGPPNHWGVNQFGREFSEPTPDGRQTAFLNKGEMQQELSEVVAPRTLYILSFWVGFHGGAIHPMQAHPDYTVELCAGESILASQVNPVLPRLHRFAKAALKYASADSEPAIGQHLRIVFRSNGSLETGVQNIFDDVRLDVQQLDK
jgi:hypothetical protein